MSSVGRQRASNSQLPIPFGAVVLTYGNNVVVPFTLNRVYGILDFDFSGNFSASSTISTNMTTYIRGASFNALHNVNNIGPNIIAWCESQADADIGTVKIHEKPVVVRVNQIAVGRNPNTDNTMAESNTPFDFEKAGGSDTNNFNVTYLFKKPLVVTYTVNSVTKYRMFNTQFTG